MIKFIQIFSMIGCAFQLITLYRNFLKFEVTSVIEFSFPAELKVPDLTLCIDFIHAIKYDSFFVNHSKLIPSNCVHVKSDKQLRICIESTFTVQKFASWIGENFIINEFYTKLAIKPNDIFNRISFVASPLDKIDILGEKICKIIPYIRDPMMCYNIICRNQSKSLKLVRNDFWQGNNTGTIYLLSLNQSLFRYWNTTWFYLTEPGILPRGFESSRKTIKPKRSRSILFFISFNRIHDKLLPSPYTTQCINYTKMYNVSDRLDLFEKCLNEETYEKFKSIAFSTFVDVKSNLSFANHLFAKLKVLNQIESIELKCSIKIVQPECVTHYWIPSYYGKEYIKEDESSIMLQAPQYPDLRRKTLQKMYLWDLIVFTGSILSFWFGFNVFNHVGQFFLPKKVKKRRIHFNDGQKLNLNCNKRLKKTNRRSFQLTTKYHLKNIKPIIYHPPK